MLDLFKALRPYQWSKNVLVFAALIFARELGDPSVVFVSVATFAIFCTASSAVYLVNDIFDRDRDRLHPEKALRPIAAGRVGVGTATVLAALLAAGAIAGAWAINWQLTAVIAAYFLLQLGYNLGLKLIPIVDALCVATGFLLRAVAGAVAIAAPMSSWLLICTTFGSVFIAFAKRRNEYGALTDDPARHRESLAGYSPELLDQFLLISAAATLLSYALYTTNAETITKVGDSRLIVTLPFVIYGLFHYLALVQRNEAAGDPSLALIRDKPLLLTVTLWAAVVVALLYWR